MSELIRGGILMLIRWLVDYPVVLTTYRLKNFTRAPWNMQPELAEKPGIVVSNYGNYFYDDMIGGMVTPVWPFAFVRDSVYRVPVVKWFLQFFRSLPFVRASDTRYTPEARKAANEKTFDRASELLRQGHWFLVFPETSPGHRSQLLTPLRPGVAHIALKAEAGAGWKLGLRLYIYGTNYENKFVGRSNVYVRWAAPLEVAKYRYAYESNPAAAEQALMNEVENLLRSVVLEAASVEQLADAHRLAHQRTQATFSGVQQALNEVLRGRAGPDDLRKIVCKRVGESVVYQVLGYAVFSVGYLFRWPFRTFGRLCASEPSEEMTYQFTLWLMVLAVGTSVNGTFHWAKVQFVATWFAMSVWLWAWRRGIIER